MLRWLASKTRRWRMKPLKPFGKGALSAEDKKELEKIHKQVKRA